MSTEPIDTIDALHDSDPLFAGLRLCPAAGFELPPGVAGPMFDLDVWDFGQVIGLAEYLVPTQVRLEFTKISDARWRTVAKELAAALLLPQHEAVKVLPCAYRTCRSIATCNVKVEELTRFFAWLADQNVGSLGQVTDFHCAGYLAHRSRKRDAAGDDLGEARSAGAQAVALLADLANYREVLSADRLPVGLRPFGGATASKVAGLVLSRQNKTLTVPDELLQPLLGAALYLVETLAPHILAELDLLERRRATPRALPRGQRTPDFQEMRAVLARQVAQRRPLDRAAITIRDTRAAGGVLRRGDPLYEVAFDPVARAAGYAVFRMPWLEHLRADFEAALKQVGIAESWCRDAALVPSFGGRTQLAWTVPLDSRALSHLRFLLRFACIVVISATSGMRWSELKELSAGCRLSAREIAPGKTRYKLVSKVIKGQPFGGTQDQWVVLRQAYDCVGLAEQLLFGDAEPGRALFSGMSFSTGMKALRAWVNSPAGARLGLTPLPLGSVSPRTLRQTLAVALAYRPNGLWAVKVHLKHVSVVTSEGYASRPGGAQGRFLAEVGTQEQQRNLEIVAAQYEQFTRGVMPSGPGADELVQFLQCVDGKLGKVAGLTANVVLSDRQVQSMMARRAKTLHLGAANYCWYQDPDKALCHKLARRQGQVAGVQGPMFNLCDSARCPQATQGIEHREVWARTVEQNTVFIGQIGRGHKEERARLQADLARAQRVLDEIDRTAAGRGGTGEGER
ncbi:MAG TPA: hypothetical protein VGX23_01615 [Actinocrinis sp.]|nr:hypothetical protein [Actinocrinis sp.]